jgi:serine/threonine-protein kinase
MPRAEKSLRQHLDQIGAPFETSDAIAVLKHIGTALVDLDGKVVHRDLKPENVLCSMAAGASPISAFLATPRHRRHRTPVYAALSPPYAAPERWRESGRRPRPTSIHSAL